MDLGRRVIRRHFLVGLVEFFLSQNSILLLLLSLSLLFCFVLFCFVFYSPCAFNVKMNLTLWGVRWVFTSPAISFGIFLESLDEIRVTFKSIAEVLHK